MSSTSIAAAASAGLFVPLLALLVLYIAAYWRVFEKAGQPGWAAIIPIYNSYIMIKIAGRPGWWLLLFFIPIVNFFLLLIISIDVAKNFGKTVGFGFGLWILSFIFYPILGFGSAVYIGSMAPRAYYQN
jgi:hypothetical protein